MNKKPMTFHKSPIKFESVVISRLVFGTIRLDECQTISWCSVLYLYGIIICNETVRFSLQALPHSVYTLYTIYNQIYSQFRQDSILIENVQLTRFCFNAFKLFFSRPSRRDWHASYKSYLVPRCVLCSHKLYERLQSTMFGNHRFVYYGLKT